MKLGQIRRMRYKGCQSEQTLSRHYPHVVELVVPLGGPYVGVCDFNALLQRIECVRLS